MSVSETLKEAVSEKNIEKVRDRLWGQIIIDPTLSEDFKEAWDFCLRHGIREDELYQDHDGRDVNLEPTEDNFSLLAGALRTNFSKKRLEAVRKMGGQLHPKQGSSIPSQASDKAKSSNNGVTYRSVPKQEKGDSSSQEDGGTGKIVIGIVLVAAAIVAGAILLKKF
ncbi:MAG: hypothetical protein IKA80_05810 [Spirochaetaceae bacterium]|nr:hypothetical protein [Spirochaetaceae bacterium]